MFGWLRGWWRPGVGPRSQGHSTLLDAPPQAPTPPKRASEPEGFASAWALLHPEAPPPAEAPGLPPEQREATDRIELQLMEHFHGHLPEPTSFPSVAVEVIDLLEHPDPDLHELLNLVDRDPAIAVQLLRLANSAYYAREREAQDLRSAVMRLGVRASGEIAVAVAGQSLFDMALRAEHEMFMLRLMNLYHDALTVGFGASEIAFREQVGQPNQAFLGGLFHDIGHSLALRSLAGLMLEGRIPPHQDPQVLDEVLERVHLEVGTLAVSAWGLPAYLGAICTRHHEPELPPGPAFGNLHLIRVASGLLRLVRNPEDGRHAAETSQSLQALGIPRERAAHLYSLMTHHRERAVGMLSA
ncbi:MAG TPA: HDOD domain-containing protein [Holophagaceae bacterium]|nr:HDOD domain-containing protein [Holophagaceae bacterium]